MKYLNSFFSFFAVTSIFTLNAMENNFEELLLKHIKMLQIAHRAIFNKEQVPTENRMDDLRNFDLSKQGFEDKHVNVSCLIENLEAYAFLLEYEMQCVATASNALGYKQLSERLSIETLNLSQNSMLSIPQGLCKITSLKFFNLAHNKLAQVPSEIRNLGQLRSLDLQCNELKSIPSEIGKLRNLNKLRISGNSELKIDERLANALIDFQPLDLESKKDIQACTQ